MTGNSGVLRVVARRSVRHLDVGNTRQPLRRGASGHHGDRRALDRGCAAEIVGATTSTRAARGDEPVGRITDLPDAGHVAGIRNGPQQRDHRRDAEGRCCMNTLWGWGGLARISRDPPQEPHYRDAVEGPSHV